jgi:hypothetical protein
MIWIDLEVREEKRLIAWLVAAAVGLDSYEYTINLCQGFGVITLQDPTLSGSVIFIENTQVDGLLSVGSSSARSLETFRPFTTRMMHPYHHRHNRKV